MIKTITKADRSQWWQIARADENATFYHTPAWVDVATCMSDKYQDTSLSGQLKSGTNFVLPMCSFSKIWPLKRVYSVYDNCYGGVIADGPISNEEYGAIFSQIPLSPFTSFDLTETPGIEAVRPLDQFTVEEFTCSILDLKEKSFEDVFKNYTRTHRTNYRKGIKAGITIRPADLNNLSAEMDHFYAIYHDTHQKRWGDGAIGHLFERDFLSRLEAIFKQYPENAFLWFAELDGEPISAAINFGWNGRMDGWMMGTKQEFFKLRPTTVLITELIRHAIDNEYATFDFGPNLGNQGAEDFKRRFGADTVTYKTWHRPSPVLALIDKIRG